MQSYVTCVNSREISAEMESEMALVPRLNVSYFPTVFIN